MGQTGRRIGSIAAVLAAALAVAPLASAATVEVAETPARTEATPVDPSGPENGEATLTFKAAPAEANRLTVSIPSTSAQVWDVRLVDTGAPLQAGPGCGGGGAPGTPVDCHMHEGHPVEYTGCPKPDCHVGSPGWRDKMLFTLGDGGSSLDASALPELAGSEIERPLVLETFGGAGNDTIRTGAEADVVHSSQGDDLIETGAGDDALEAGPVPDGADRVDLGSGNQGRPGQDTADYGERTTPITWRDDGLPEDGAAGERDDLIGVEHFAGGSAGDLLEGNPSAPAGTEYRIEGGGGADAIAGGPSDDQLNGGPGDDTLIGLEGNDELGRRLYGSAEGADESGDDTISGGPGDDFIRSRQGDDRVSGGSGSDVMRLGPGDDEGSGGAGLDQIGGEEGADKLSGGSGADYISGGAGPDQLLGGAGADQILAGVASINFPEPRRPSRRFLYAPGPLDRSVDSVDCGGQRGDIAAARGVDHVDGCRQRRRVSGLEIYGAAHQLPGTTGTIQYTRRLPGHVSLTGPGVERRRESEGGGFSKSERYLQVLPRPAALARLHRAGHLSLAVTIALHRPGGGDIVRHRLVRLHLRRATAG